MYLNFEDFFDIFVKNALFDIFLIDPDSVESLDPYRDPDSQSGFTTGSESRRAKITHKKCKKVNSFQFFKCWMFFFAVFSCSLEVHYGGLGIRNMQFLIKKEIKKFQLYFFSLVFAI